MEVILFVATQCECTVRNPQPPFQHTLISHAMDLLKMRDINDLIFFVASFLSPTHKERNRCTHTRYTMLALTFGIQSVHGWHCAAKSGSAWRNVARPSAEQKMRTSSLSLFHYYEFGERFVCRRGKIKICAGCGKLAKERNPIISARMRAETKRVHLLFSFCLPFRFPSG